MRKLQVLDLFSGIGGFSLGLESTGYYETVTFCEIEEYPRKVLKKHWPEVPIHDDIHTLCGGSYQRVDLVCGGFPCQPVSLAGKRKGKEDPRWLWPEFFRVIQEARPRWCLIENVPGLRTRHADEVLGDLEEQGYTCWPLVVGAGAAGTSHKRKRVWVVAHAQRDQLRQQQRWGSGQDRQGSTGIGDDGQERMVAYAKQPRLERRSGARLPGEGRASGEFTGGSAQWDWQRAPEPVLRGVDDGLPCGLHRRERLKALGNAVVPQVVAAIGRSIVMVEILRQSNQLRFPM